LRRMQTRITAAEENGYTLRLDWELHTCIRLADENGCNFDAYEWPWTKIDIPDRTVQ
jgi:hypothetical protein